MILFHTDKDSKDPNESLDSKGCVYECQKEQNRIYIQKF